MKSAVSLHPPENPAAAGGAPVAPGAPVPAAPPARQPSPLYRADLWRVALMLPRLLPWGVLSTACRLGVAIYAALRPGRFEVVRQNLTPLPSSEAPDVVARRNFSEFGRKLAALWRFEAGMPVDDIVRDGSGWEHFSAAAASGRGVLLVTPHLGNWEFGGPLLSRKGVRPLVLTAAEPGAGFTELRRDSRGRHGIETLVVGRDPFAFVEVIKRLQDGGVVALLIDRPQGGTAVTVEFCGRPFEASVAAAELARATGCIVLPVVLPREGDAWVAHALPPVAYERRALTQPAARVELTKRIMAAFEPWITRFADQWFHFVPVWPELPPGPGATNAESCDPGTSRRSA